MKIYDININNPEYLKISSKLYKIYDELYELNDEYKTLHDKFYENTNIYCFECNKIGFSFCEQCYLAFKYLRKIEIDFYIRKYGTNE